MSKSRPAIMQIAVVLGTLLAGVALGNWLTVASRPSIAPAPKEKTAAEVTSQILPSGTTDEKPAAVEGSREVTKTEVSPPAAGRTLAQILRERNPRNRTKELQELASSISSSEIGDTLKDLRKLPEGNPRELAARLLITRWSEIDPEGALRFASENRNFDYIASDVFQQLAADDLQGALARAQSIPNSNLRYQALRGALGYMAVDDPSAALTLAKTLEPFPQGEPLSQVLYRQWAATDPQAAAAQASQDRATADSSASLGQVLRSWASRDPMAAIDWAMARPDSEIQVREIAQVIRQWSRQDLGAAANWVNTLPSGNPRDAAAAALASSIASTDPRAAIGWVQSITDTTLRDTALQRLSREIVYRDPTNGATVLKAAGVPPNMIPPPPEPNQRRGRGP